MDPDQARFFLDTRLPGDADTTDPEVMAAMAMAGQDPALAQWWADVRACDATFAAALQSVHPPAGSKARILDAMSARRADYPELADDQDARMAAAIASIRTPASLRARLLMASAHSARQSHRSRLWRKFALPFAAAAGITMALLWEHPGPTQGNVAHAPLPIDVVQASFIRAYQSPLFTLDEHQENQQVLLKSLEAKGLPCPCCLPPGLKNGTGIGCREFLVDGHRGAVICFDHPEFGVVHLVVFHTHDVSGSSGPLPDMDKPAICREGSWTIARWQHADNTYLLIGSTDEQRMAKLF